MLVQIISNIQNGLGLQRHYEILKQDLEALGHEVQGFQWTGAEPIQFANLPIYQCDLQIFIEIFDPQLFTFGKKHWFMPMPEYYRGQDLAMFDKVLCCTGQGLAIFRPLVGLKAEFCGFRSRDLHDHTVKRQRKFLHAPGQNMFKGTDVIIEAWNKFQIQHQLTLITPHEIYRKAAAGNSKIDVLDRVESGPHELLMNLHQFHLCPARYEGWGHTLHEAMGVGAVVVSNLPEFGVGVVVESKPAEKYNLVTLRKFEPEDIYRAVEEAMALSPERIDFLSHDARRWFDHRTESFRKHLELLCA